MNKQYSSAFKYHRRSLQHGLHVLVLGCSVVALPTAAQSLWKEDTKSMVADKKASAIGDIVTIIVQESNTATKDQNTKTGKKTAIDASISSFLFSPTASNMLTHNGQLPALKMNSATDFDGGGSINNAERITARIAVRVVDVLPNGNLVIEGSREIAFSGETQTATLRGTIRSEDVTAANTVFSYNIADATIKYLSKGTLSNAQKKGWFTRFWEAVTPF